MTMDGFRYALRGVAAYRALVELPLMQRTLALLDKLTTGDAAGAMEEYARLFYELHAQGDSGLGQWLYAQLLERESPYAGMIERGEANPVLEEAARRDIEVFSALSRLECGQIIDSIRTVEPEGLLPVMENFPRWRAECPFDFASLTAYYRANGAGIFARQRAFLWENGRLFPVEEPDCPGPDEMLGYELQREEVIANTRAMLEGRAVNNVLLYGDSGTGKSATVKSLLSIPGFERLRLIEVQKEGVADLPRLMRTLRGKALKFILFIDDLAFDQDDKTYSVMKTILEGGLERRPDNVAIYAPYNRRHLVRQTFSDRAGDEVDALETIAEKTSLAERFGGRIPYLALNKASFLDLVERMAEQDGVSMDRDKLRAEANKWEMRHPGRTPRTAKQFIASLHG